LKEQKE